MLGLHYHDRRDRVLEDELLLAVRLQDHGVFIEALDSPRQLYPAHQVDGEEYLLLAGGVEKSLLDVLWQLIHLIDLLTRNTGLIFACVSP